jgi:tetratricopeptide (TPR) repeat protein
MKSLLIAPALAAAALLAPLTSFASPDLLFETGSGDVGMEAAACPDVLRDLGRVRSLPLLFECMDFYFLNPDLDPQPASFNAPIRIGYRILQIDPHHADTYGNVAWMLWSKWSNWKEDPSRMPDGAAKLDEAVALLDKGATLNPRSAEYFISAGNTLFPVARNFDASVYPRVILWFQNADRLLPHGDRRQIRVRLDLGHIHKLTGRIPEARRYYQAVLEIDPQNRVAKRALELLEP